MNKKTILAVGILAVITVIATIVLPVPWSLWVSDRHNLDTAPRHSQPGRETAILLPTPNDEKISGTTNRQPIEAPFSGPVTSFNLLFTNPNVTRREVLDLLLATYPKLTDGDARAIEVLSEITDLDLGERQEKYLVSLILDQIKNPVTALQAIKSFEDYPEPDKDRWIRTVIEKTSVEHIPSITQFVNNFRNEDRRRSYGVSLLGKLLSAGEIDSAFQLRDHLSLGKGFFGEFSARF